MMSRCWICRRATWRWHAEKAAERGVKLSESGAPRSICPLSRTDETFDAVLLMGPLYHLLTIRERLQAVMESERVLKPGGLIFAAFITRFALFRDAASKGTCQQITANRPYYLNFWTPVAQ
jgi:SAM-dependent methyltransferase